ncbi:bifunctional UDP-N-acetylmuramoyl-tripeptide:D-alanyl-D-alanine ligase/alanine racemase [Pseudochryseolinea flava]|uniref:Alanine racemase n=1 Tax=Pseudochryseolinea flava TaxID=2059302 RepID=A0A364Y9N6_9BACT|nr:bifunctional UDP-N-acetylmuramoyl-tripeptide:D-alanyl-D-alanine ligase/alanine racemase [Pseudochryseolinea flava]RAW03079.1 bifunctional UDP-N-acetylmuramoyl-tripeptide:D-alanyl-D-alanine ligase/alanine racemase [Pseudochryseolinea flava]
MILFSQLVNIIGGQHVAFHHDDSIEHLYIDSRKISSYQGALFFAIKGERHDGHRYLRELVSKGIKQFIVEHFDASAFTEECNVIQVPSAVHALQRLAAYHRAQFTIPVIGITGSNGKTIVKEWLYQILSRNLNVVKNPGSYNSQVGVPLSVWQMQAHHQLGIFEAGISQRDEMAQLEEIIQPSIGIFTNIGTAHDEGFNSRTEKIKEKLKLFANSEILIYCKDHDEIDNVIRTTSITSVSWGESPDADLVVKKIGDSFAINIDDRSIDIQIPFIDKASIENIFHIVTLLIYKGYDVNTIQQRIAGLRAIPMRLELKDGINGSQIIDDTYNNDLGGLDISIQFLLHQHQKRNKTVILSDILESGLTPTTLVSQISSLINGSGVTKFIGIGPILSTHKNFFTGKHFFYASTDDFLNDHPFDDFQDEVILVKGARSFAFEKITARLQKKVHGTVMEIDLDALVHNLNYFKSLLLPKTKVMVMVKAFAYGSGSAEVANLLQYHRADYLGVAYADEGIELRKNNSSLPIMVMNPSADSFDAMLQYDLEPEIYSFSLLDALLKELNGRSCKVHLKLDTGMHRLGFEPKDVDTLIAHLKSNHHIKVASIFSHLAGADEHTHDDFSKHQADQFKLHAEKIAFAIGYRPLFHILNSPGILRLPQFQFDMVRLGIGLYGVDPTNEGFDQLKPVATLKTVISQIKEISAGESVGYGRRGVTDRTTRIGTIAIGYADGFTRAFSRGVGHVLVNGKKAPVIGNVCMDMTMINLSDIEAVEGDEVIIFGNGLPIQEIARSINTIPYEILTNTSERVKRVFVAGSL